MQSLGITRVQNLFFITLKRYFEHISLMSDKNQEFQKKVSEQGGVEGQRKEVNVEDYPKATGLRSNSKRCGFSSG